jgi:hypothetical protein
VDEDLPALQRHIEPLLGRRIDLADPFEFASFLALAQHHGFPTPLLDFTASPFIAAFFAFEPAPESGTTFVRIFELQKSFLELFPPISSILTPHLVLRILLPSARENPRALPQQSELMFCNSANMMLFVRGLEATRNQAFLRVFDIPIAERVEALRDLSAMGITAATMYPGIDGTCRAIAWDRFGSRFA